MRKLFRLLALLAAVAASTPLWAQDKSPLGILDGQVLIGSDGDWDGDIANGSYRLVNAQGKTTSVRYFHVEPPFPAGAPADGWTFSADVTLRPAHERAFAGLMYDFEESPRHYLIFALTADGSAVLWRRRASGIEPLAKSEPVKGRRNAVLRVIQTKARSLFLVGQDLLTELPADEIIDGEIGIIAGGRGASVFSEIDWQTVTVEPSAPVEPPAAPPEPAPVAEPPVSEMPSVELPPALPTAPVEATAPVDTADPVAPPAGEPATPSQTVAPDDTSPTPEPTPPTAEPVIAPEAPASSEPAPILVRPIDPAEDPSANMTIPSTPSLGALGGEQPPAPSLGALGGAPAP